MTPKTRVVVADANVLVNLIHVSRLHFCSDLPGLMFMVPDHVREEITRREQRAELDQALDSGLLHLVSITDLGAISLFADLVARLGRGEAACLVLAEKHGWSVASDEKGQFRREAVGRLGETRILGTAELFVRAIDANLITVEEADADKAALERKRFRMPFRSFRDAVGSSTPK